MHRIVPTFALAAVVVAGCGNGGAAPASDAAAGTVEVRGTDALTFEPSSLSATPGAVTIELTAGSGVSHTVVIEGVDGDRPVVAAAAGETATGSVELSAGTYTLYCSVPGHRDAGMTATLNVS